MNDLIERIEAMGRQGGMLSLAVAAVSIVAGSVLAYLALYGVEGLWFPGILGFGAALLIAGAMVFGLLGLRLLTQRHYPSAAEVFPPLPPEAFKRAVRERDEALCACTRCRVVIVATFSTGSCPVCTSSVDYYEVDSDEDAEMVVLATL